EIHRFGIHSQLASFSVILLERLELIGTTGGSKERIKWSQEDSLTDPNAILVDFKSAYHFSWSAGAKVILLQWGQTFFCTDFTYFAGPSSANSFFKFFNQLNLSFDSEKQEFYMREWQLTAALASRFFFLTPYVGGIYLNSHLHVKSGPEVGPITYKNKDKFGWFYGITLSLTGRLHLNFERRQGTESAYAFATTAVF
ncbi:MAG TPA: hypothetical protein VFW62_13150, partial [bacterium]|nr:hypothetical protein [bacterium]